MSIGLTCGVSFTCLWAGESWILVPITATCSRPTLFLFQPISSPMFRFTIRDVLSLMVVVGMGLGWQLERMNLATTLEATRKDLKREREKHFTIHVGDELGNVRRNQKMLVSVDAEGRVGFQPVIDGEPASQIPEASPDE